MEQDKDLKKILDDRFKYQDKHIKKLEREITTLRLQLDWLLGDHGYKKYDGDWKLKDADEPED